MTRFMPCSAACFKAKARDAIVFPPPVGTVRRNIPRSLEAISRQCFRISVLLPLIVFLSSFFSQPEIPDIHFSYRTEMESPQSRSVIPLFIKVSVFKKSASTRQEYNMRMNIALANPASFLFCITKGSSINCGI